MELREKVSLSEGPRGTTQHSRVVSSRLLQNIYVWARLFCTRLLIQPIISVSWERRLWQSVTFHFQPPSLCPIFISPFSLNIFLLSAWITAAKRERSCDWRAPRSRRRELQARLMEEPEQSGPTGCRSDLTVSSSLLLSL